MQRVKLELMGKKLSPKIFILSQLIILVAGLAVIFFLNYSFQYQGTRLYALGQGPITTTPTTLTLEVAAPGDNILSFQSSVVVSGSTSANIPVLIATESESMVIQSAFDGSFSTVVGLQEGVNQMQVTAFSMSGDQRSINKTIYYSKEKI